MRIEPTVCQACRQAVTESGIFAEPIGIFRKATVFNRSI